MRSFKVVARSTFVAVIAAAFVAALCAGPAALAASAGIEGRLVNGTSGELLPGVEVTLHLFSDQAEIGTATTTADREGAFSFPSPASGVASFELSAVYKGSEYRTASFSAARPAAQVTLKVWEPTTDAADVVLASWIVWVDREGTGAAVQHSLTWRNDGDHAYVGSGPDPKERVVTQVPLAPGATNFQFLDLFLRSPGSVRGQAFVDRAALPPGTSDGTIRYTTTTLGLLSLPITLPTETLRVFVPQDVTVRAPGLTPTGRTTQQGVTYSIFVATGLDAGDQIDLRLTGLTAAGSGGGPSSVLVIVLGSLIVLAMGIVVVWRLGRTDRPARRAVYAPRRSASRLGRGDEPGRSTHKARSKRRPGVRAPARSNGHGATEREDDEDIDLLIDEIAALDLSFERGLLDEKRYRALRAAAKRRLVRSRDTASKEGAR